MYRLIRSEDIYQSIIPNQALDTKSIPSEPYVFVTKTSFVGFGDEDV